MISSFSNFASLEIPYSKSTFRIAIKSLVFVANIRDFFYEEITTFSIDSCGCGGDLFCCGTINYSCA